MYRYIDIDIIVIVTTVDIRFLGFCGEHFNSKEETQILEKKVSKMNELLVCVMFQQ